ncbi:MAG: DUF4293 domain-containing protein [Bacteroidales bacterium]|nr:DUF4293 domain-containing protein [Candidatus Liminaster caballi]
MLQRIQTVYMLASVIAMLMMLVMPLGTIESANAFFNVSALGVSSVSEEVALDQMRYGLFLLLLLAMALPLVCIFLYKKRKLQQRILIYTATLDVLFYAYFFLFELPAMKGLAARALDLCGFATEVSADCSFVLYAMPALSVFCCVMAWRGVTYDIALLASADRLRSSRK